MPHAKKLLFDGYNLNILARHWNEWASVKVNYKCMNGWRLRALLWLWFPDKTLFLCKNNNFWKLGFFTKMFCMYRQSFDLYLKEPVVKLLQRNSLNTSIVVCEQHQQMELYNASSFNKHKQNKQCILFTTHVCMSLMYCVKYKKSRLAWKELL